MKDNKDLDTQIPGQGDLGDIEDQELDDDAQEDDGDTEGQPADMESSAPQSQAGQS